MLLDEWIAENLEAYLAQAVGTVNTVLSAAQPKTDEPPRLAEAINLSKCDPPPEGGGFTNTFDPTTNAIIASKATVDLNGVPPASAVIAIIQWIDQRARQTDWNDVWESQGTDRTTWPQDNEVEEQWARRFEQLFLGTVFDGISSVYNLSPSGEGLPSSEGWVPYIYGRIQKQSRQAFERPVSAAHKAKTPLTTWGSAQPTPLPESLLGNWTGGTYAIGTVGPLERKGKGMGKLHRTRSAPVGSPILTTIPRYQSRSGASTSARTDCSPAVFESSTWGTRATAQAYRMTTYRFTRNPRT